MPALIASLIRTFVPIVAGFVISLAVSAGITLEPEFEGILSIALTSGFTFVYYLAVRLLETYVTPKFGWLLGVAKAPVVYAPVDGK